MVRLLSVSTEPTDMSASPSHFGGSTTLRPGRLLPHKLCGCWPPWPICAETKWLDFSLSVNDSTIRN